MTTEIPEAIKPYTFHGLEPSINGKQAVASCPFCNSKKFFINKDDGRYDCKKCGASGNKYTFLTQLHKSMLSERSSEDLKTIRGYRNNLFPTSFLEEKGLCLVDGCVVFPIAKPGKDNLVNLKKWQSSNRISYNTPTLCSLYYPSWADTGPIYICEGEWDALALLYLFQKAKWDFEEKPISILAVPGANTFKESWINEFTGRDVYLIYDADHDKKQKGSDKMFNPGQDGMDKVTKLLSPVASSVNQIRWSEIGTNLKDGYDVSDFVKEAIESKKSKLWLKKLLAAFAPTSLSRKTSGGSIKPLKRISFAEVVADFEERLEFNQTFIDVLACCFAAVVTLYMGHQKRNPIWLFIVAPASCLHKDTRVLINRAGKTFEVTLEQLYNRFHGGYASGKQWRTDIETMIQQRSDEGTVRLTKITDVIHSGVKRVYEVKTASGKIVKASKDHKFLTVDGWKILSELSVGDELISNQGRDKIDDRQMNHVLEKTFADEIISIKRKGFVDTYDVSVEAPHNFMANGICVHNSGKTTIIEAFDGCTEYAKQVSKLTPASLVTGLNVKDDFDPSLLSELRDNVLFIKDFTPVLTMGGDREAIFGILRDAYDGSYIARYATGVREYRDLFFGIVAGVTHAIEQVNMSDLGERFLRIRLLDEDFDELSHIEKALDNVDIEAGSPEHKEVFQASVLGYINHIMVNMYQPTYSSEMNNRLAPLAQIAALCRTNVPRTTGQQELYYRAVPEVASRIATELKKVGLGIALVYQRKHVDDECYRVMQKVAFDSCIGWKLELIQCLDRGEYGGMSIKTIASKMNIHVNQVRKIVDDAMLLGMVTLSKESNTTGRRGNKTNVYTISDYVLKLMRRAKISFGGVRTKTKSQKTKDVKRRITDV